jgi:predicted GH43/DUF377 family glycosyl hydrolase
MKINSILAYAILFFIVLIPVIFYSCFTIGMISTNSPKTIKLDWVKQYKTIIRKDFSYINDVKIYYQQGRVRFDFTTSKEITLEDCKQITKMTKNFIQKETVSKPLDNGSNQLGIRLKFDIDKASYDFESPYWISSQEPNVNPNIPIKNDYKTWDFNINGIFQEKLEF